jgi:hypothetical protein
LAAEATPMTPPQAPAGKDGEASVSPRCPGGAHHEQQSMQLAGAGQRPGAPPAAVTRQDLAWVCSECEQECWPIRAESRWWVLACAVSKRDRRQGRTNGGLKACSLEALPLQPRGLPEACASSSPHTLNACPPLPSSLTRRQPVRAPPEGPCAAWRQREQRSRMRQRALRLQKLFLHRCRGRVDAALPLQAQGRGARRGDARVRQVQGRCALRAL